MLFLLYLALPQTQGSSYIYTYHLQPFFHAHETQIDAALASLKARAYAFIQERFRALWDAAANAASGAGAGTTPEGAQFAPLGGQGQEGAGAPPTLANPASGPAQLVGSLWRSYGPGIMASGAALMQSATAAAAARPRNNPMTALNTPPGSSFRANETQSVYERRRQLEAELAALPAELPIPAANNRPVQSRGSSSSDLGLRERTNSNGRFEEIEVPSDVEGYDTGNEGQGHATTRPGASSRVSWFGWGAGPAEKSAYERVKSD